jgi:perosamine synthetase
MKIPLCVSEITQDEKQAVLDVLDSGWLVHGNYNKEFEERFSRYLGVKHAITLNSCTSALFLAVKLNGLTGEVLVPSFTFVASANAIVTAGATPVFVDIEEATRNIDPVKIEAKITEKTQAIMPVHFGGLPCDMDAINMIARKHDLIVIEDSAETLGALYKGRQAGSFGVGCFSFFPTKNMTSAEGGMLTTHDDDLAARVKAFAGHGIEKTTFEREKQDRPWLRAATFAGYNLRMSNVHAAIGLKQLERLDSMNQRRQAASEFLTKHLRDIPEIQTPLVPEGRSHVYQMYTILLEAKADRTVFIKELNRKGIGASVHFDPPVHQQSAYSRGGYDILDLSVTENVAQRIVTLPMFPAITQEQLQYMIEQIKESLIVCS